MLPSATSALLSNASGTRNTATGFDSLKFSTGDFNTATGYDALRTEYRR